jgi:ABC-type polysaccharide/polyol phosphate export permease
MYRNTFLGYFWNLIEPLAWFAVLYLIFTIILEIRTEDYALYLFLGIMLYQGFTRGTMRGMHAIISKSAVVSKIALPLEVTVVGTVLSSFISMLLDIGVFLAFMVGVQFLPPASIVLLPAVLGLDLILILAVSLPLSVLSVFYRDLEHTWQVVTMIGFWATPITYRFDLFPPEIRTMLQYNPMAGIVELGHAFVLGNDMMPTYFLFYTIIIPFVILFFGYAIFKIYSSRVVEEL